MPTLLQLGQVWQAWVPFSEEVKRGDPSGKRRPVVLLGWALEPGQSHDLVIVPSSTFNGDATKARSNDLRLLDYDDAGLGADSFVRCGRVMSISPQSIDKDRGPLGTLTARDLTRVVGEMTQMFAVTTRKVIS